MEPTFEWLNKTSTEFHDTIEIFQFTPKNVNKRRSKLNNQLKCIKMNINNMISWIQGT